MNFPKYFQRLSEQEQAEWIEDKKEKDRRNASLYNAANREKIKARLAKCYAANKGKRKEYYAKNLEKIKAQLAKYRAENKEKIKEYRAKNSEKLKKNKAEYRAKNKDRTKKYNAKYYATKRKPKMIEQKARNRIKQEKEL
jgi:hypothetical protein